MARTSKESVKRARKPGSLDRDKVPRDVYQQRMIRVWELDSDGWSPGEIAREVGISERTVYRYLADYTERVKESLIDLKAVEAVSQISKLKVIYSEAMREWQRSKGTLKRVQKKIRKGENPALPGAGGPGGEDKTAKGGKLIVLQSQEEVATQAEDRFGNVQYLETAMFALDQIRKIMGINAPEKMLVKGLDDGGLGDQPDDIIDLEAFTVEELRAIAEIGQALEARQSQTLPQ